MNREELREKIIQQLLATNHGPIYSMELIIHAAEKAVEYIETGALPVIPPCPSTSAPTPPSSLGGSTQTKANPVVRDYYKRP